ncbi:hypothetical protein AB0L82_22135 [Nocardia sp. NPDC052001]|uniref:hypothetical protein n=1 Tax=Nocardia sp. NPDC052001 TaxID=3154853 RepID=UPI00343ABB0D
MSIYARSHDEAFEQVTYAPAVTHYYGSDNRYGIDVPAMASVRFSSSSLILDIEDARALMEALAVVLVEHAVAQKNSLGTGPKLVA